MKDDVYFVEIKHLKKIYDSFLLQIPEFWIKKGEVIGLVGENGAGKSTLIKLILHLVNKDAGTIKIFGNEDLNESAKRKIGVVFDQCCFSDVLCVNDMNLIFKNIYQASWNETAYFHFAKSLSIPLSKPIVTLSQGMKTKLSIISALAHSPRLLILDEATSGLDPVVRKDINEMIIHYVQQTECSVIFSSHLVNELEHLANRIIFMKNGRIVASTCFTELQNDYYIVLREKNDTIPQNTLAWFSEKDCYSCLIHGDVPSIGNIRITKGITTETLMYFLDKGNVKN